MESKPTPGPWGVEYDGGQTGPRIVAPGKRYPQCTIARVIIDGGAGTSTLLPNARLIAAAPDLLAVVQGFRQKLATYVHVYQGDKELRRLLDECDAAISKAQGDSEPGR